MTAIAEDRMDEGASVDKEHGSFGSALKAARKQQGITLRLLASKVGVSASMLSMIENNSARPSVATLYRITRELGISLDSLFDQDTTKQPDFSSIATEFDGRAIVARNSTRPSIELSNSVHWERLNSDSMHNIHFQYARYDVGGESCPENEFMQHDSHEYGFVISGILGLTAGRETHELRAGDSVRFDSKLPHRLFNIGDQPTEVLWLVIDDGAETASTDRGFTH